MQSLNELVKEVLSSISSYEFVERELESYISMFEHEVRSKGLVVNVRDSATYIVVGDIHGDLNTLSTILSKVNVEPLRKGDSTIVFLGDYIDRGPNQLETIMSVLKLKELLGDAVIVLRGNHEPPKDLIPYPHDFPNELTMRYGYEKGLELYNRFLELFNLMPHAAFTKNGVVFLHGGLPTTTYNRVATIYEYFLGRSERESKVVLEEVLWNDPIEANIVSTPSPRGAGYLFGIKVTEWFTRRFKFRLIVRGHEPVERGYKINHRGKVLTLFSRLGPPYFNLEAAYLVLRVDIKDWEKRLRDFIRFVQPQ